MSEEFQDFERLIIQHWQKLNADSIDEIDFLDAAVDFFEKHPKIDPEDLKFSSAFENRIKKDASARNLLDLSSLEDRDVQISKTVNELEI